MADGKVVFMFPGQGSQYPGMGKDLYDKYDVARDVFRRVADFMGKDFLELMFYGTEEELTDTKNAQPAIYAVSVAALETLRHRGDSKCDMVMGHSLGEFSALYAAGVMEFEQGLRLVRIRGELMADMADTNRGGMAAIIGLDEDSIREVVDRYPDVIVANYNAPGQIVISGGRENLKKVLEELKPRARRIVPLRVSGAFHSPLMEEAAREFQKYLKKDEMRPPRVPIAMNTLGRLTTDLDEIYDALVKQLMGSVRFIEMTLDTYRAGGRKYVEVGPGKVLQGLVKRILKGKDVEIMGTEEIL